MPMGTDKNKTKQCPQKERGPEDHTPPRLRTEERSFHYGQTSCGCQAIQNYRPLNSICPGHLFLRLRLHVSTFNRMLDAAKIHVCSVVNTDVADRKEKHQRVNAVFSYRPEAEPGEQMEATEPYQNGTSQDAR